MQAIIDDFLAYSARDINFTQLHSFCRIFFLTRRPAFALHNIYSSMAYSDESHMGYSSEAHSTHSIYQHCI